MLKRQRGFTLIEVLIVILIISIVAGAGVLSLSRQDHQEQSRFVNNFVQSLILAEDEAILLPATLGVIEQAQQWSVVVYTGTKWVPIAEKALRAHPIPHTIQLTWARDGKRLGANEEGVPRIIISPSGELTPFTLYVGKPGEKPRYQISGQLNGQIETQLLP